MKGLKFVARTFVTQYVGSILAALLGIQSMYKESDLKPAELLEVLQPIADLLNSITKELKEREKES